MKSYYLYLITTIFRHKEVIDYVNTINAEKLHNVNDLLDLFESIGTEFAKLSASVDVCEDRRESGIRYVLSR